jgi:uncharacterized iron-regulated protein
VDDEKLRAYEETRARVSGRLLELRAEQRRMNWLAVPGVVAIAVARWYGFIPMVLTATIALSVFCVSHYVVYMHIDDSKLTLKQLRKSIDAMKSQPAPKTLPEKRRALST